MTYNMMEGWGGMAFGGLMMIFWLAVFVGLIVLVVKVLAAPSRQTTSRDALETLKQRFAHGDIDIAEFQERSRQLRGAQ